MAGGGTGGHVIPALAVARELRQRGHRVFFVGTDRGLEARLVPEEGFELRKIDIGGLNRGGLRQKAATLARLPFTTLGCSKFFRIAPRPRGGVLNILITGGSQGSRTLNEAGRQSWPIFRKAGFAVRILHQTGPAGFESMRGDFAKSGLEGEIVAFIRDMPAAF